MKRGKVLADDRQAMREETKEAGRSTELNQKQSQESGFEKVQTFVLVFLSFNFSENGS